MGGSRSVRSLCFGAIALGGFVSAPREACAADDDVVYRVALAARPKAAPGTKSDKTPAPLSAATTEVHGHVVSVGDDAVVIRLANGTRQTIPWSEVKRVSTASPGDASGAGVVVTRDGVELHGALVEETDRSVTIVSNGRRDTIPLGEIARMTEGHFQDAPSAVAVTPVTESSDGQDVVQLADGSTHRGKISELAWGDHVTLVERERTARYAWKDVVMCTRPRGARGRNALDLTPDVTVSRRGVKVEMGGTIDDAARARQEWLDRGGWLVGYDASASLLYMSISAQAGSLQLLGGGAAMHVTAFYLDPPVPGGLTSTWKGFRIGTGLETAGLLLFAQANGQSGAIGASSLTVPASIGGQLGFGSFLGTDEWKGVMVGFDYKPSYSYTALSTLAGSWSTNYVGFQLTLDFVDFHTVREGLEKQVREASWRVSFFGIPPVGDLPLLLTLGVGAVWY